MTIHLKNWEQATQALADYFMNKYFKGYDTEWYWIGGIGGTLFVNDYFFDIDRIVEVIRFNAPEKKLFEYYDLELKNFSKKKKMKINFENYLKLK